MTSEMFFESWPPILRILLAGSLAYAALIVVLRISGKRTLSKLNAFDLVVTVAIGSTFATILTDRSLPLAEGVAAFVLLAGLQFVVSTLAVRWRAIGRLIKAEPTLLLHHGEILPAAARRQRVADDEILTAVRASGGAALSDAACVVLESDGSLSVIAKDGGQQASCPKVKL